MSYALSKLRAKVHGLRCQVYAARHAPKARGGGSFMREGGHPKRRGLRYYTFGKYFFDPVQIWG